MCALPVELALLAFSLLLHYCERLGLIQVTQIISQTEEVHGLYE